MKYVSPYYATMSKFNNAQSNMNRLCKDIERWEKREVKFRKVSKDFDYTIMVAPYIPVNQERYNAIDKIFCDYCREIEEIKQFAHKCKRFPQYKEWFKDNYPDVPGDVLENWEPNWNYYYEKYKKLCREVCPDKQELANIAVHLCYVKYPSRSKRFIWKVAEDGILLNLLCKQIILPQKDPNGEYEYLGKKYSMVEVYNSAE